MSYKIRYIKEHLILDVDEGLWVLDTGAPASFGSVAKLEIHDQCYDITSNYMGFDNEKLSEALGKNVEGLIGGDILNNYDSYWDLSSNRISFSTENINIRIQNTEGEQYAILAVIIIVAIGAAIFYLKGYKRNR